MFLGIGRGGEIHLLSNDRSITGESSKKKGIAV